MRLQKTFLHRLIKGSFYKYLGDFWKNLILLILTLTIKIDTQIKPCFIYVSTYQFYLHAKHQKFLPTWYGWDRTEGERRVNMKRTIPKCTMMQQDSIENSIQGLIYPQLPSLENQRLAATMVTPGKEDLWSTFPLEGLCLRGGVRKLRQLEPHKPQAYS